MYKTQNEYIIKAVTILQIFWPLVCWKMAVQTVRIPVCNPDLPLDKNYAQEYSTISVADRKQSSLETKLFWIFTLPESSIVIVVF